MKIPVLTELRHLPGAPLAPRDCPGLFWSFRRRIESEHDRFTLYETLRPLPAVSCPGCGRCFDMLTWLRENPDALLAYRRLDQSTYLKAAWSEARTQVNLTRVQELPPRRKVLRTVKKSV